MLRVSPTTVAAKRRTVTRFNTSALGRTEPAVSGLLSALLVVSALLFVLTSANVSGMLLARAAERRTEISIRQALGAGRSRIVTQLVAESLVLFVAAGLLSVLVAGAVLPLLSVLRPPLPAGMSIQLDTGVDWRVMVYACLVAAAAGILFTLIPSLRSSAVNVGWSLRESVGTASRSQRRARAWLVGGQMTVSVLLLVTASLLTKALAASKSINPGWVADGVYVTMLEMESTGADAVRGAALFGEIEQRLRNVPGVQAVSLAAKVPFMGQSRLGPVNIEGRTPENGQDGFAANFNRISENYFRSLQIPLLQGRDLTERDNTGSPNVVIVNQAMALRFWPKGNAVGQTFWVGPVGTGKPFAVVGVAANTKYQRLTEDAPNFYFIPYRQRYNAQMALHVRLNSRLNAQATGAALNAVRAAVHDVAPSLPVNALQPMNELLAVYFLPQRLAAWIAGVVGIIGAIVGLTGVYGMAALSVTQRKRELSVRLAIGATPAMVVRMLVKQELRPVSVGLLAGFAMAAAVGQLLRAFLGSVSPLDPAVYVFVAATAMVGTCIALWVPARRVARLAPSAALRE